MDVSYIPISLVVAVQANVDTEAVRPKIQKIHSMLAPLVAGDQGEIAVVAFDHRIDVLQDFTTDADLIARAFEKIGKRSGSSTSALNDAVRASIRMLARRPADRRRVLLIISEARDKGSESKAKDVMVDAQLQNVLIESVNISRLLTTLTRKPDPPRPDPIPPTARPQPAGVPPTSAATGTYSGGGNFMPLFIEIFKQTKAIFVDNPLEVYTRYTGGREHSFTTQAGLENAISRIGEELHNQYIIAYSPSNPNLDGSYRLGSGRDFVIEGDEYDSAFCDKTAKFLKYLPDVAVIGNLEYDHADIYADMEALRTAFRRFVGLVPRTGRVILGADSDEAMRLATLARCPVVTFGTRVDADWRASAITPDGDRVRFDLTVPLARYASSTDQHKPFKRYAIDVVWRKEEPQRGRFREFYQADADIIGSASMRCEAELLSIAKDVCTSFGFDRPTIMVNNRKILDGIAAKIGIDGEKKAEVFRVLDKLDKIGEAEVEKLLYEIIGNRANELLEIIRAKGDNQAKLALAAKFSPEGAKEIEEILGDFERGRAAAIVGLTGFGASAHLVLKMVRHRLPDTPVYVFSRTKAEQSFARELGAMWAGDASDHCLAKLNAIIDTTPAWGPVVSALGVLAPGGRLVINAIRKESRDQNALLRLDYATHLWLEKEIKSVANVTRADVSEFLALAAEIPILPEVQEYRLEEANTALGQLKAREIRGAKILHVA